MRVAAPTATQRVIPIYRQTACKRCGHDDGVGVRYRGTVLCLDCYRRASRADREGARHHSVAAARYGRLRTTVSIHAPQLSA